MFKQTTRKPTNKNISIRRFLFKSISTRKFKFIEIGLHRTKISPLLNQTQLFSGN